MKILLLEDHNFFGDELADYFLEQKCQVFYAHTYDQARTMIVKSGPFDYSFLDILLQNGRTGIDILNQYESQLGKVMFVTGCTDVHTLDRIKTYASASKLFEIWPKIQDFMNGGCPRIADSN